MAVDWPAGCQVPRASRFIDVSIARLAPQMLIALELVGLMIGVLNHADDAGFLFASAG
jgi:hypothetical protein